MPMSKEARKKFDIHSILVKLSEQKDGENYRTTEIAGGWDLDYQTARDYVNEMRQQGLVTHDFRRDACSITAKGRAYVKEVIGVR